MQAFKVLLEKVDFLPPHRVTDDTSVLTLKNWVLEPLCRWDEGLAKPGLFERWTHSEDGCHWEFQIRKNAIFHDGKPCVAEDILSFIQAILESVDTFGMKWSYARYLAQAQWSSPSPQCVVMDNPFPLADILDILSEFFISRLDPQGQAVLGTGSYRVLEYSPQRSVQLERVGAGPLAFAQLQVLAQEDADERYRALLDQEVDAALNLERMHATWTPDPRAQWQCQTNTLSVMYYLNCSGGLFASELARRAVNLAVNKTGLIEKVLGGLAVPSATVVSPFHLGWRSAGVQPWPYDPDQARALLAQCDGLDQVCILRTPLTMPHQSLAISQWVQRDLEAVGLRVQLQVQEDRPEYAREIGRKEMGDLAIFDSSPHSTYRILNDKISSRTKAVWWQGYTDPVIEDLITRANNAVTSPERARAYGDCLHHLHHHPPWLYLCHPIEVLGLRPGVKGVQLDPKGVIQLI